MSDDILPPLATLLCAHAGAQADRHRAIWAFDGRLAAIARTTSEAMIGQMRLAWWNDVIDDPHGIKGQGEPVIEQMRATGAMASPGLTAMIDGWEVLVVEPEIDGAGLHDYAAGRGGGLFRALADAADPPDWLQSAGQVWALWDLSGHVGDDALAQAALVRARALVDVMPAIRWPGAWKPLRLAYGLARQDVLAGRRAPPGVSRGMALRLLRLAIIGR